MKDRRFVPFLWGVLLVSAAGFVTAGCCLMRKGHVRTCLSKQGCPPKRELLPCGANVTGIARPLAEVIAGAPKLVGQTVTVRSRLRREGAICTALGCAPGTCCNGCGAFFVLTTAKKPNRSYPHTLTLMNTAKGPHPHAKLACGGDDSLICCPFDTGQQVVVTGKLAKIGVSIYGPNYALQNPRICRPQQ